MSDLKFIPVEAATSSFEVRDLANEHRTAAARLIRQLIIPEFEVADLIAEVHFGTSFCLEAVTHGGLLMGVSCVRLPDTRYDVDLGSAQLQYLAVARSYQRRYGIGSALLAHSEQKAREAGMRELWLAALPGAVPFYEKQGYTCISAADSRHISYEKSLA